MRYVATVLLVMMMPALASAEIVISNNGSVTSHTSSSASSGGNSVGSGGSVQTGSASASASSETTVDGGAGTVEIHVETEVNGVKQSETVKKELKDGEKVEVRVATSSSTGGTNAQKTNKVDSISIKQKTIERTNGDSSVSASTSASVRLFERLKLNSFFSGLGGIFRSVFSFFSF